MKISKRQFDEWKDKVLERDGYSCCVCRKKALRLNAHHIIPRTFKEYALEIDNGITLCTHCHRLGKYAAHQNPIWFSAWLQANRQTLFLIAGKNLLSSDKEKPKGLNTLNYCNKYGK